MLNNIITTVLRREGKIALPSIGIIVRADFDGETTYLFTPMAVKADVNLVSAIAAEMEISQSEAVNIVDCYVEFIRGVISRNGKYSIKGVGDIQCNENNVYYFTPLNVVAPIRAEAAVVAEVRNEITENEVVLEEIVESTPEPVVEESTERMNERFQSKRLGEIIEGGANKRFYDKVHSQVVSEKEVEVREEVRKEEVKEEMRREEVVPPKRKGLYDIYDKGFKHEATPSVARTAGTPPPIPTVAPVVMEPQAPVVVAAPEPVQEVVMAPKKKKTDVVLVISIIVIIVGLAFIGYFYYMQQNIEL